MALTKALLTDILALLPERDNGTFSSELRYASMYLRNLIQQFIDNIDNIDNMDNVVEGPNIERSLKELERFFRLRALYVPQSKARSVDVVYAKLLGNKILEKSEPTLEEKTLVAMLREITPTIQNQISENDDIELDSGVGKETETIGN